MQAKKFYKEIQQKIDQNDYQPEWNQEEVWQRIEQRYNKKNSLFFWRQAMAASIVLVGLFSTYFFTKKTTKVADSNIVKAQKVIVSSQVFAPISANNIVAKNKTIVKKFNYGNATIETTKNVVATTTIEPQNIEQTLLEKQQAVEIIDEKVVRQSEPIVSENASSFVPNKALIEIRIPKNRERIAILEIPDDYEAYHILKKEKRNGNVARLARKKGRSYAEENAELSAPNGKPNKVWAFVKESFKNETIAVDSLDK